MAWTDDVPTVSVVSGSIDLKRRVTGQKHVLFRLVDPMKVTNVDNGEELELGSGVLSDGSSVPGPLWGALHANPADLLLPGFAHDYAYRRGAKWKMPSGGERSINRYEADLLHIAICRLLHVWKSDQAKIFFVLRTAGGFFFQQHGVGWDGIG